MLMVLIRLRELGNKTNEDKIVTIINPTWPEGIPPEIWPQINYFGLFDGHGGDKWSEFLKSNLHTFIFTDPNFLQNPKKAIINGFEKAENEYLNLIKTSITFDQNEKSSKPNNRSIRSGSCAVIAIWIDNKWYIANVGDSRALLSFKLGNLKSWYN